MKYLKRFESDTLRLPQLPHRGEKIESGDNISIFDQDWFEKILPDTLELITQDGDFTLKKNDSTIGKDIVQFNYWQLGYDEDVPGSVLDNGEPSTLEFDIHFVKNVDGIKLLVDITYGDNMACEFTIESPNKINIIHYNGFNSKYDPKTYFGFSDKSLDDLIKFFNAFNHGLKLNKKDFTFIDKDLDSYKHDINDKDHYYTDDSDLLKFGNSMKDKEPSIKTFESFLKKIVKVKTK